MRVLIASLLLAAAPAPADAQPFSQPVLEALRRSFPGEHKALAERLAGQPPEASRRLVQEAMARFQIAHKAAILAAPGERLLAIEALYGPMLRMVGAGDMRLCAVLGDRGLFGRDARAAPAAAGLNDYAVALIEAAAAGAGRPAPEKASGADFRAWIGHIERREPGIPVRQMLTDRELRAGSSNEHLCKGAAVMHEAVADLPADQGARVAAMLIGATIIAEPAAE